MIKINFTTMTKNEYLACDQPNTIASWETPEMWIKAKPDLNETKQIKKHDKTNKHKTETPEPDQETYQDQDQDQT